MPSLSLRQCPAYMRPRLGGLPLAVRLNEQLGIFTCRDSTLLCCTRLPGLPRAQWRCPGKLRRPVERDAAFSSRATPPQGPAHPLRPQVGKTSSPTKPWSPCECGRTTKHETAASRCSERVLHLQLLPDALYR